METEELKELLAESSRAIESSVRRNLQILAVTNIGKAGDALAHLARGIWLELAVNLAGLVALGSFAADHAHELRFLVPAIALCAYAVAILVACAAQLAAIGSVRYDEPVVALARRLERLRLWRIRTTLGILLFAPLMWVPLYVVAMQAFFRIDAYAGPAWLAANLAFGLATIPLAVAISRGYGANIARTAKDDRRRHSRAQPQRRAGPSRRDTPLRGSGLGLGLVSSTAGLPGGSGTARPSSSSRIPRLRTLRRARS